jgi:hypothetical protein
LNPSFTRLLSSPYKGGNLQDPEESSPFRAGKGSGWSLVHHAD